MKIIGMKIIAVDYDGTLNTSEEIAKLNTLFEDPNNFIVIYTARSYQIFPQTRAELLRRGIKHHALVMEKMRADCYIDDRNKNWEDL